MGTCVHGVTYTGHVQKACKLCKREMRQRYYVKHKEEINAKCREYHEKNKEKNRARNKKWREQHKPTPKQVWRLERPYYGSYRGILKRCLDPNNIAYSRYGGRGITVCDRWLGPGGYWRFQEDMGARPTKHHSVERRNNNEGYSPDNCYWATMEQQSMNRSTTVYVTINGVTKCAKQWAKSAGISSATFSMRMKRGDTGERLIRPGKGIANRERKLEMAIERLLSLIGEFEGRSDIEALIA